MNSTALASDVKRSLLAKRVREQVAALEGIPVRAEDSASGQNPFWRCC